MLSASRGISATKSQEAFPVRWFHKVPENTKTEMVCATEILSSVTKCQDTDMRKCEHVRSASRPAVSELWPAGLPPALVNEVSLGRSLTYLFNTSPWLFQHGLLTAEWRTCNRDLLPGKAKTFTIWLFKIKVFWHCSRHTYICPHSITTGLLNSWNQICLKYCRPQLLPSANNT